MVPRTVTALAVVAMLLLAGCSGGIDTNANASAGSGSTTGSTGGSTGTASTTAGSSGSAGGAGASANGSVNFYVSDQKNAIGDFEHVNVSISAIKLHRAGGSTGDETDSSANATDATEANATADVNASASVDASSDGNASGTASGSSSVNLSMGVNVSSPTPTSSISTTASSESAADSTGGDAGGWVTYHVDNVSVDLTELQGPDAVKLSSFGVPQGKYTKVVVEVSHVDATLNDGQKTTVKLPSNKLQLNKGFTVGDGQAVNFVFDITVHEAGRSGKYVLKPVIGQSGTDHEVALNVVGDVTKGATGGHGKGNAHSKGTHGDDASNETDASNAGRGSDSGSLNATFVGDVTSGENATVRVTRNGTPVENASVQVDGDVVATTDSNGEAAVPVPTHAKQFVVVVTSGDARTTLTQSLQTTGNGKATGKGKASLV